MKLRELISNYRAEKKLSQRQFATICDLSNGYISMLERGKNPKTQQPLVPTLPVLKKIADGMNISLAEMLTLVDDMPVFLPDDTSEDPWTLRFRNSLSVQIKSLQQSNSDISGDNLQHLSDIVSGKCALSFPDACNIAVLLDTSLDEMIGRDIKKDLSVHLSKPKTDIILTGHGESPSTDESTLEDEINKQIMDLVKTMTPGQKDLLFAMLNTTVAKNLGMLVAAQASDGEVAPKTERPDRS